MINHMGNKFKLSNLFINMVFIYFLYFRKKTTFKCDKISVKIYGEFCGDFSQVQLNAFKKRCRYKKKSEARNLKAYIPD